MLRKRMIALACLDSAFIIMCIYAGVYLTRTVVETSTFLMSGVILLAGYHLFANRFKLYKRVWQYASIGELFSIIKAVTYATLVVVLYQLVSTLYVQVAAVAVTWMMLLLLIGGSRFGWRLYRDTYRRSTANANHTLIIGAGSAGTMVARQLKLSGQEELYPVAFIDDDPNKVHMEIMGLPVVGGRQAIAAYVQENKISYIIIAIPSLSRKALGEIYAECQKTEAKTQIMPRLEDLMVGKVSLKQFRDVEVEDLLGRDPVDLDIDHIAAQIQNKTILITGAGGSIGSEICRQIAQFAPQKMILLGHGENSIYEIELELKNTFGDQIQWITEIADIQNKDKMFQIVGKYMPSIVFHAAAHKHVPLMEQNPDEAVKNNVIGTHNIAEAAATFHVDTFVMISTDKAVNPVNVMGATKRMAEMIIQHMNELSKTKFVSVRFGNVLGSRGSVIPIFKEQIRQGGPVTVTHPDMIRYFMTIPEASRLVLQACALAEGGEVFVLNMGEPVKIKDLAINLIKLSGYTVEEIGIKYIGLRPGEKMFEELLSEDELHVEQIHPMIYTGTSVPMDEQVIQSFLESYLALEDEQLRQILLDIANYRYTPDQAVEVL